MAFRLGGVAARKYLQVFSDIRLRTIALLGENFPRGYGNKWQRLVPVVVHVSRDERIGIPDQSEPILRSVEIRRPRGGSGRFRL